MSSLRIFIAESVSAEDFYEGRVDGYAANEVLKIQGVSTIYRMVLTRTLLDASVREAGRQGCGLYQRAFALTFLPVIARRAAPWQSRSRTTQDRFWRLLDCHAASAAHNDKWVKAFAGWYYSIFRVMVTMMASC